MAKNQLRPEELALPGNRVSKIFGLETCDPRDLPRLTAELAALLPPGREERLRRAVTQWLLRLLRRLLPGVTIPETAKLEEMPMLEETILEWWNGAREEGRSEGRKEGELQGRRQMLLRLLEQRFGRLPQKARRRVGALASARELEGLLGRAMVAKSLEELGLA